MMEGIVESGARGMELKESIDVVRKRRKSESNESETVSKEVDKKIEEEEEEDSNFLSMPVDLLYVPKNCAEQLEHFANYVIETGWRVMPHHALPSWLRDNEYLLWGHRPPLPSFKACLESCFRIHTETGNIWTHFIGAVMFIVTACYFLARHEIDLKEKLVFLAFFLAAICCLMFSAMFHAFCCYSPSVSRLFSKLDYCGIAILIVGSYVPWLYYAFYCETSTIAIYSTLMCVMAAICIVVSLWDRFGAPEYRVIRAGIFIALGSCGVIPGIHYLVVFGSQKAFNVGALSWFLCTALLYLIGASLYAARIPERLFPGKFDIWFQSHQIFHVFVVAAAYVHYCGITRLASYRLTIGDCLTAHTQSDFSFEF